MQTNTPGQDAMTGHEYRVVWLKMLSAWVLTAAGGITLQTIVQVAALVYTCLQIWILLRDKVFRIGKKKPVLEADTTRPSGL
jgi:hypothetical protein